MGGGQSTGQPGNLQAQAEIARLKAELAKATAQVGALSAQLGPANAAAVTTAESHKGAGPIGQRQTQVMGRGAEDTVEQKFARPDGDKARKQRDEVSAEANKGEYVRKEVPKSVAVREMLKAVVVQGMLFENLGDEERNDCVEAFYKVNAAKGETVIQQGDKGVNFYAVAEGSCTITVQHGSGPSVRYGNVGPGNSFGELALLYNTPRAATVKAEVPTELWVLDRATYRAIAAASVIGPSAVTRTGTLPIGLIARKALSLLSLPISKAGTSISTPLYRAMIRLCSACVLP